MTGTKQGLHEIAAVRGSRRPGSRGGTPDRLLPGRSRGHSLVEMIVAMTVMGVMVSIGVPRFQRSLEQSRADLAGANLRAVWSAQRLYWLENRTYAPNLETLVNTKLLDPALIASNTTYSYQVADSSDSGFTATATRIGNTSWTGSLTIIEDGTLSGSIQREGEAGIVPGFQ